MAAKRSAERLVLPEGMEHGQLGWDFGCGCEVCRAAQAARVRDYRARRKANGGKPLAGAPKPVEVGGSMETKIRILIDSLDIAGDPRSDVMIEAAIMQARHFDRIPSTGKWHLLAGTIRSLSEILDALQPKGTGEEGGLGDFLAGLRGQATQSAGALRDAP